jgi:hypothetical protein
MPHQTNLVVVNPDFGGEEIHEQPRDVGKRPKFLVFLHHSIRLILMSHFGVGIIDVTQGMANNENQELWY